MVNGGRRSPETRLTSLGDPRDSSTSSPGLLHHSPQSHSPQSQYISGEVSLRRLTVALQRGQLIQRFGWRTGFAAQPRQNKIIWACSFTTKEEQHGATATSIDRHHGRN